MMEFQVKEWISKSEEGTSCNPSQHPIYFQDTLQKVMNYCASKGFLLKSDFAPEDKCYMEILEEKSNGELKTVCFMGRKISH